MTSGPVTVYDASDPSGRSAGVSERSRAVALALAALGGFFGLHRFYTGRVESGVWMCLTLGGFGIWYLYDLVMIVAGEFVDDKGRRVSRWEVSDPAPEAPLSDRRAADLEDRMLALESQVNELAERMDFAERLLAKARERGALPKA